MRDKRAKVQPCEVSEVTRLVRAGLDPGSGTPFPKVVVLNLRGTLESPEELLNVCTPRPHSRPIKSESLRGRAQALTFFPPKSPWYKPNILGVENYCPKAVIESLGGLVKSKITRPHPPGLLKQSEVQKFAFLTSSPVLLILLVCP